MSALVAASVMVLVVGEADMEVTNPRLHSMHLFVNVHVDPPEIPTGDLAWYISRLHQSASEFRHQDIRQFSTEHYRLLSGDNPEYFAPEPPLKAYLSYDAAPFRSVSVSVEADLTRADLTVGWEPVWLHLEDELGILFAPQQGSIRQVRWHGRPLLDLEGLLGELTTSVTLRVAGTVTGNLPVSIPDREWKTFPVLLQGVKSPANAPGPLRYELARFPDTVHISAWEENNGKLAIEKIYLLLDLIKEERPLSFRPCYDE